MAIRSADARVRVFVPGSIGNVGPGLDILGLAVAGLGDTVTAVRLPKPSLMIDDPGDPSLPVDPAKNAVTVAARAALDRAGARGRIGIGFSISKGLPLAGGQGGSAASAVAGAVAANALMGSPLDETAILEAALEAETAVAGRHLDNIAPSFLGGLVLIRSLDPIDVIRIPTPKHLRIVLAKPDYQMATRKGRSVLPKRIDREVALAQAAQVAAIVAGGALDDLALFGRAITDHIAEPVRAPLLPGFLAAKAAALLAGALGCSISGSGPTLFALASSAETAERVGKAVSRAYRRAGHEVEIRLTTVDQDGARILK